MQLSGLQTPSHNKGDKTKFFPMKLTKTKQKKFTTIENSGKPLVCMLTLWAVLFLMPLDTPAQTVNIPDANLRAAVAEALGKAPGATITADEMATLTHLAAHDRGIRDLTGLAAATRLEEVRLNDSLISDLSPLAALMRLRVIEFRHNVITDLSPVAGLINLRWLVVPDNLIADLSPVEDLINLEGLEISRNVISDLSPLAGLIKLHAIWMSENLPADLSPLTGLINLRDFHSWGTPISNLAPLAELPKLTKIDICGGDISDLSALEGLTGLKELYLVGNEITDISPLASLTGLTRLSLDDNEVSDVSPLAGLINLTWIELQDNAISDFSPLAVFPERVFINLNNNPAPIPTRAAPKIAGPWLWVIVSTEGKSGSSAAASGTDFLQDSSGGAVTELEIATQGATEGDRVGNKVWTVGTLSRRGGNNINELVNATGLGIGDINHHVAYGLVTLDAPRQQNTKMFVGSGDAVKVWLNGELVHDNPIDRDAEDYQENFGVTLEQGTNILLVAVYEGEGWWGGFFGFDAGTDYTVLLPDTPTIRVEQPSMADVNGDGEVSILDLLLVARDLERTKLRNSRTDINGDGQVSILDLTLVAQSMDSTTGAAAPASLAMNARISPKMIRAWIAQAQFENAGSLAVQQGIANLQRLLMSEGFLTPKRIPEKTGLLANYPNPFNPETWIPYQLATGADVQIRIYAAPGALVRTLNVGHQPAGLYQQRSRAAYWDGKNESGEPVASGVYFYTLTAGDFTATRKMLIRK